MGLHWIRRAFPPGLLLAGGMGLSLSPVNAADLTITLADTGVTIAQVALPDPPRWCVLWRHSVQGFEVSDCYEARDGEMVLVRSHLPDFAAGLGHIPDRGRQISDGEGGYFIEDIDEPVPGNSYVLRPGTMSVDHRIRAGDTEISLSRLAEHQRVRIALEE